ncbi:MAG: hypothetical protein EZS28_002921 [Streblomastix strix]|uniref:Uncharacterized protein n=1 Tax=Streblomastix strix TaxID=222440 RepID=A0A5J4X4F4_9EUKA|nr:MAG: hypothetical protein EZS28_002921 [Streblomastix strix]
MSLNPQNIDKLNSVQFSIPIIDPTKAKEISDVQRYFPTEIQTSSDIYSLKTLQIVELGGLNITQTLWWQTQYNLIFALICTLNGQLFIIDMSQQTYIVINYRGRKENEKQGDIGFIGMHITKMRIKDEEESEYNKNIINEKKDGNEQQKGKSLYQDVIQHTPLSNHKTDLLIQTSTFEIFLLPLESEDGELLFHIGSVANKENSFIFIEKKNEKTQKDNIKERMSVNKTDNEKDVRILDQNISVRLHLRRVMIRQLNTGLRLNPVGELFLFSLHYNERNKKN